MKISTTRAIELLLKKMVGMNNQQIVDQYAEIEKSLEDFETDPIGGELVTRLLKAAEAIAVVQFGKNWRLVSMAVHHIDGNHRNNDPKNLRLVPIRQHAQGAQR